MKLYKAIRVELFSLCDTSERFRALVGALDVQEIVYEFGLSPEQATALKQYVRDLFVA